MDRRPATTTPPRRRRTLPVLLAAVLGLAGAALAPPRVTAADSYPSECPEITDSITRLYYAYLQRPPDANEFHIWAGRYQRGEATLGDISSSLLRSDAYLNQHGAPSDRQFIEATYRTIRDERPSQADIDHWVSVIERGYPRAQMVLTMSETEQFTRATNTVPPLAGYNQWYPAGTHWYCGSGSDARLSVIPLAGSFHVDMLFRNTDTTGLAGGAFMLQIPTRQPVTLAQGVLPGSSYDYRWDQRVESRRSLGGFISISAEPQTSWAIVFHPQSIGPKRHGWEIRP